MAGCARLGRLFGHGRIFKMLVPMCNVIKLNGGTDCVRKIWRKSRMSSGKTFKLRLMTGIALPIGHLLDVKVHAAVFGMTHRAGCVLQIGPSGEYRIVSFSLGPAKRMAGQTLTCKIRPRKNGFHPFRFVRTVNRMTRSALKFFGKLCVLGR